MPGLTRRNPALGGAVAMVIVATLLFQLGAVLAKGLFPRIGVAATVSLRLALAVPLLMCVWRPWRGNFKPSDLREILVYGISMGCMNFCFYKSIGMIPLGVAVAIEFTGPFAVAVAASRRGVDFVWAAVAATALSVLLLSPQKLTTGALSPVGVGFALAAGFCWAIYIVFGRRVGHAQGGQTVALGVAVAAILVAPFGLYDAGTRLLTLGIWPAAVGVAILSTALPYSLEILALARLPARVFGVLMSLGPAMAALLGLVLLGERLTLIQWLAIAGIVVASCGTTTTRESATPNLA